MVRICLFFMAVQVLILVTLPPYPWDQPLSVANIINYVAISAFWLAAMYFGGERSVSSQQSRGET
jgi:hypothetical protein